MNVRFGVMVVGNTCGGKSRCIEVLKETFNSLNKKEEFSKQYQYVESSVLNPKSISM